MATVLNDRQKAVLDWIADGCPDDVYEGEGHKVSAAALRARGLIRIRGRGGTWQAEPTDRGRAFLRDSPAPDLVQPPSEPESVPPTDRRSQPPARRGGRPPIKTEQLVADVIAAGGHLVLPDETANGGVNWRQRAYAAQRHGKVPDGKRLVVSWDRERFVIDLRDGATGNELGAEQIHVPARLTWYHPVARQFRDRTDLQQVSRKALPRASRIVHALAVEIERRGHMIECARGPQSDRYGRPERSARDSSHLIVTVKGHDLGLRIFEKGVGLRSAWEKQKAHYEENRLNFNLGYLPSRPTAYDKDATGRLDISLLAYGPRQTTWGDRKRWKLDDRLAQVVRELETQAEEAEEARQAREREEAERQRRWEAAMEHAKHRFVEDHQLDILRRRVQGWQEADAIRAYCDAVEARHDEAATQPDTPAWLHLAREHADRLQRLPTMPDDPEITNEALKPYLGSWSPYGPSRW